MSLKEPRIPQSKIGDEIANYLRSQIVSGQLRPGERIQLDDLANRLGVSRMPVRDAVLELSYEGLTEVLPRRRVIVAAQSKQDVLDVYAVLAFVGGIMCERAATLLTEQELSELERLRELMRGTTDSDAEHLDGLNWQFHGIINRASRSSRLILMMRKLIRNLPRHFYHRIPGWSKSAAVDHDELMMALRARDGKLAGRLAHDHLLNGGTSLVEHLGSEGFWDDVEETT